MNGVYASLEDLIALQYKARGFTFLPRQPVHSLLTGKHSSRMRGRGLNFEELRGYLPGDDIRTMDWRVTARARKPYVRVFTEERDRPCILVVDQRMSMFFGSKRTMKSVAAAELTALAAWRVFSVGDRVGAVIFNDEEIVAIRPHRSRKRVMHILQTVIEMNHKLRVDSGIESNSTMLNKAIEKALRIAKHDFLVGVFSDFDGADAETRRLVTELVQHNDVIAALVYDPLSKEVPDNIQLVVSKGELQAELDTGMEKVRKRLIEHAEERIRDILSWQSELGVPVMPISTAEGVAEQIRNLLGQRSGAFK